MVIRPCRPDEGSSWSATSLLRIGFALAPEAVKALLLRTCWTIPVRQVETSVVLARPAPGVEDAQSLVSSA